MFGGWGGSFVGGGAVVDVVVVGALLGEGAMDWLDASGDGALNPGTDGGALLPPGVIGGGNLPLLLPLGYGLKPGGGGADIVLLLFLYNYFSNEEQYTRQS